VEFSWHIIDICLNSLSGWGWNGQKQDLTTSFHDQVRQTVCARGRGRTACRAQVTMMPIGTPKVPYRTPQEGGWQWVDIWNVLYRERIIFIGQYIDEEFGNQILATMLYLDSVDNTKPLYLYINSPGGDVHLIIPFLLLSTSASSVLMVFF
jgi:ATP-dependent Clp protease protease subunit